MILVVGLSPAWQRSLLFARIVPGQVNRAQRVSETASGKGVNVARVLGQLGVQARLLTVAGGQRGRLLTASLRQKKISANVVRVAAETRVCQTLLSSAPATELVEEAGELTPNELARVISAFSRELRRARALVLSGTVPPGGGADLYARLTREAVLRGLPVLVDAQRQQLWNAVAERPLVVKVNREELLSATGEQDVPRAIARVQRRGAQWVVVSDGAGVVVVADPQGRRSELRPPRIRPLNPIGSGDAMLAGVAVGVTRGWAMAEAVKYGVVSGAANALTLEPGNVSIGEVQRLWRGTQR